MLVSAWLASSHFPLFTSSIIATSIYFSTRCLKRTESGSNGEPNYGEPNDVYSEISFLVPIEIASCANPSTSFEHKNRMVGREWKKGRKTVEDSVRRHPSLSNHFLSSFRGVIPWPQWMLVRRWLQRLWEQLAGRKGGMRSQHWLLLGSKCMAREEEERHDHKEP